MPPTESLVTCGEKNPSVPPNYSCLATFVIRGGFVMSAPFAPALLPGFFACFYSLEAIWLLGLSVNAQVGYDVRKL